jgi:hypothetical protein
MKGLISRLLIVTALHLAIAGCGPSPTAGEGLAKPETRPTAVFEIQSDEVLTLVNGTLIDGTGVDPLPDAVLVIQEGRIIAVGPRAEVHVPDDANIIDVQGATILWGDHRS